MIGSYLFERSPLGRATVSGHGNDCARPILRVTPSVLMDETDLRLNTSFRNAARPTTGESVWRRAMAREMYPREVIQIALAAAEGFPFERFAQEMYSKSVGAAFVPTGGVADGGADGVVEGLYEDSARPTSFFQASIRPDVEQKIRSTVSRLREVGREVKSLVYFTSQQVSTFDMLEARLSDELDATIRIRDAAYLVGHVNDNPAAVLAFRQHLSHYAAYLQRIGSSKLIPVSTHVKSPAVFAFLSQEVQRRSGDTSSLHAMIDALLLWALEGTDPDKAIFMSRDEVLAKIVGELPSVDHLVRDAVGPRLEELSRKGSRLVRWHQKEDLFCLPFETRLGIEEENATDVVLRDAVVAGLRRRIRSGGTVEDSDVEAAAEVALRALQLTFERQGLEFAAFLHDPLSVSSSPEVMSSIRDALSICGIHGSAAVRVGPEVFRALRDVLYKSTDDERLYLHKLSTTYALLFILNTEPRLMEFFQDMTGDFYLYVGADQLIKALSEQYLEEPDQMARNALRMASSLGATLVLAQPVLEEVIGHFRAADHEFRNHIAISEQYMTYEVARNVSPIMVRAYLYSRINPDLRLKPKSWQSFVQQFCSYDDLHRDAGEDDFLRYLVRKFQMTYASLDDLEDLVHGDDVAELSRSLAPQKSRKELADNDALMAHAVFGRRVVEKEAASTNEFGFSTWWLTGETSILKHTGALVAANRGARYIMRPEFLLNFISLAPSADEARKAFEHIFPTLLGIKLARRMPEGAFAKVMENVNEASSLDDDRRGAAIASIVDKLKGDFSREYVSDYAHVDSASIDVVAARKDHA